MEHHKRQPLLVKPYLQVFSTRSQTIPSKSAVEFEEHGDICRFKRIGTSTIEACEGGTYLFNYAVLITYPISDTTQNIAFGIEINGIPERQTFFAQGFSPTPIRQNIPAVPSGIVCIPPGAQIRLINIDQNTGFINNDQVSVSVITASLTLEKIAN